KDHYHQYREWAYKNVKPRILAEKYYTDEGKTGLKDYKFFCFHGVPKITYVVTDRQTNLKSNFYDIDFNHLDIRHNDPNEKVDEKPENYNLMVDIAKKLSIGFPHVRIDLYNVYGK